MKTPVHKNIAEHAINSNRARLIVDETKSEALTKMTAKVAAVVRTRCRGIRCMRTGEEMSRVPKPSTMLAAMLS